MSLTHSTRASYRSGIHQFQAFCRLNKVTALPATQRTITYFTAALSLRQLAPPTIKVYLSAVASWHREHGYCDPCRKNPLLALVKRGATRAHTRPPALREPITTNILRRLLQVTRTDRRILHQDRRMLIAAFCVAFHGLLRVSEFTSPAAARFDPLSCTTLADLRWTSTSLHLTLKQSKTDKSGKGQLVILPRLKGPTCPHTAMTKYLKGRKPHHPRMEPLFRLATGKRLTQLRFRYLLRRQIQRAGLNPQSFNTHSFRIGAATSAAQAGVPAKVIKRLGRWRSRAYRSYIRPTTSMIRKAASTITQKSCGISLRH